MTTRTIALLILGLGCWSRLPAAGPATLSARLVTFRKIWDQAPHNAFTDLIRFQNKWFCVFREGTGHVSPDGAVRVLWTDNGHWWESAALIRMEGFDLRDPKLSITPDGRQLMLLAGAARREAAQPATESYSMAAFSPDGWKWGKIFSVGAKDYWLWRLTWHHETAYGVAYDVAPEIRAARGYATSLLVSTNGTDFKFAVPDLHSTGGPTEATLRFGADDTLYCLQRRDGKEINTALLGTSRPPYTGWSWKDLGQFLGGPNFIQLPGGHWIACGRLRQHGGTPGPRTVVCELNVASGDLIPLLALPSGGDNSYPGLAWHENQLWITYYSSHEERARIYLARVALTERPAAPAEKSGGDAGPRQE